MVENIFQYTDYRTILRDHFEETKKRNPSWSYGSWAKKTLAEKPIHSDHDRQRGPQPRS